MTKITRRIATACTVAALIVTLGCASPPGGASPPLQRDTETLNDWKKVIHVSQQGSVTVRKHVGYLNKQYSEVDPEGIVFVLDDRYRRLGFVLPTGQAYRYQIERQEIADKVDLGNYGFDNGVKNVLGLTGTVEYETVTDTSSAGAGPRTRGS